MTNATLQLQYYSVGVFPCDIYNFGINHALTLVALDYFWDNNYQLSYIWTAKNSW